MRGNFSDIKAARYRAAGRCFCAVAGLEVGASLEGVDLRAAAQVYLTGHGMAEETLKRLMAKLDAEQGGVS